MWDLPTRLFHWAIVLVVALGWWTGENENYDLHLKLGYAAVFLLTFRLLWGVFGSSTARFASFVKGPRASLRYIRDRFHWPMAGHAPLGGLSVIALLALLLFQTISGLYSSDEDGLLIGPLARLISVDLSDAMTELHEEGFNLLLALIVLHVAAILCYRVALGKKLVGPMLSGTAELDDEVGPMTPAPGWRAIACAAAALAITWWIADGAPPFGP